MNYIRNTLFTIVFVAAGCNNQVEEIRKEMDIKFKLFFEADIDYLATTAEFICSSDPDLYWYQEGTTEREVILDHYKHGLDKLNDLAQLTAGTVDPLDLVPEVVYLRNELINEIGKEQASMKKKVNSLRNLNTLLFTDTETLINFTELISGNSEPDQETKMPKRILELLENLRSESLYGYRIGLIHRIDSFKTQSIENVDVKKISPEDLILINEHFNHMFARHIKFISLARDTSCLNEVIDILLEREGGN